MSPVPNLRSVSRSAADCWLLIDSWLAIKSANTIRQYNGVINAWCAFLGIERYSPEGADVLLLADGHLAYEYIGRVKASPAQPGRSAAIAATVSAATISRTVTILFAVYRELVRARYIEENPFALGFNRFKGKMQERRPSRLIPFEAVKSILARPDATPKGQRDAAFLALLFGGGLRINEALKLTVDDVTESDGCAVALLRETKSGETRAQVISFGADKILQYRKLRLSKSTQLGSFLPSYADGEIRGPWSISSAHRTFKRYCVECGLPAYSPHCARATAITKLLESGLSHRDVSTFSRHSSVQMVERYDKRRLSVTDAVAKKLDF